ncbi:FAD-dependent oxidoreductase [Planomonospora venezuelensis]|uniref:2-polyprenyl-6-methoxyphenol hydroxylase-like FAD-dependent oxidoreductase n=1 Tax=Planomonospora venezuelensis TaxID=1999 RepID=A0A841D1Q6_PLAVE|nr:NAD(P)/FAD-dependent oxidoreductase [Planomonospora venezuelensis]MBB5962434.1 2-polyprenyl-6-methoxyphenol hydroxylase-like FAD-dependent oxidoreductase [Planomonospora venezuelensis]GIN00816.1 oxidoreductase [Planomonospora venezuelensis]
MIRERFHVAVIGGGIGGLCLAQGLRRAGVSVTVYERDRSAVDRSQGFYHIRISPQGARALHDCLPPRLWDAFVASTVSGGQDFAFLTEQMRELLTVKATAQPDPVRSHHAVSRITLREVLLSGLEDVVVFGKTFERYERAGDGKVVCHFDDGSTAVADLVVGADGGNSRVRRQYLPHAQRIDTGIITIAGKFPLTEQTKKLIPARLYEGPNNVIPPRGCGMFIAPHELDENSPEWDATSYVLWAYGCARRMLPAGVDLRSCTGEDLRDVVAVMVRQWHPDLRTLVTESDPQTVALLPIRTSVPIDPWETGNITLLGDAIHSMTPMRGIGANTALRDGHLLSRCLTDAWNGEKDLLQAVEEYETAMREYGFAAVRASRRTAQQFVADSGLGRIAFKQFLRFAERFPWLKHRMFNDTGHRES